MNLLSRTGRVSALLAAAALMLSLIPAKAATITTSFDQTQTLTGTATYSLRINNGGNIVPGNSTWTTPTSFTASYFINISGYGVPAGSTLTVATLDFNALISNVDQTISPEFSPAYSPFFPVSETSGYTTVTIGSTSITANSLTLPGTIDLLAAGAESELLAGTPIAIAWQQAFSVSADYSNYTGGIKNQTREYLVETQLGTQATGLLTLSYLDGTIDPGGTVPEPATFGLMGFGAAVLFIVRRRLQ